MRFESASPEETERVGAAVAARDEPSLEAFLPRRGDGLVLSAGDVETYRICPLRYKFARVFRIPTEPTIHQKNVPYLSAGVTDNGLTGLSNYFAVSLTYKQQGTLVYRGVVYDHVQFSNRGQGSAHIAGKNKWGLKFNDRAVPFQDHDGVPFPDSIRNLNLNPGGSTP